MSCETREFVKASGARSSASCTGRNTDIANFLLWRSATDALVTVAHDETQFTILRQVVRSWLA